MLSSDFFGTNVTVPCPYADLSDLELYSVNQQLKRQLREASVYERMSIARKAQAIRAELIKRGCLQPQ